jgi:hypothetical protein
MMALPSMPALTLSFHTHDDEEEDAIEDKRLLSIVKRLQEA